VSEYGGGLGLPDLPNPTMILECLFLFYGQQFFNYAVTPAWLVSRSRLQGGT
jgi:hypothetical protein